jgi:hypothetical protein
MTDLRELLREAQRRLRSLAKADELKCRCETLNGTTYHCEPCRALSFAESVDAALAQQLEPDCWAILTPNGSKLVSPQEAKGMVQAYPLYTAPPSAAALIADAKPVATLICPKCGVDRFKSPCGNASHIMTCPLQGVALAAPQPPAGKGVEDNYVAWLRWNGRTWTACDSDAKGAFKVYRHPSNAIPREIHERLMRDAKAQALRDFRDWLIGETRSAGILAQDVVDALERRARFHEQSAPGGK